MANCDCGYSIDYRSYSSIEEYNDKAWSCSEKGLLNHISFPPFQLLPCEFDYYEKEINHVTKRWCLMGEIVRDISLIRHSVHLETRFGEKISVRIF